MKKTYECRGYADHEVHIHRGDRVRVPAGVLVGTTAPGSDNTQITKRAQTVVVHHITRGSNAHGRYPGTQPQVTWAGAGGYWRWADMSDVELITE